MHISHACNLWCESCSHYSNQKVGGNIPLSKLNAWASDWSHRLNPRKFTLLGGEPTLHPQLSDIIKIMANYWCESEILELTTNGFLLHKHPDLPAVLEKTKFTLCVSIHHDSPTYTKKMLEIIKLVDEWQKQYDFKIFYRNSKEQWTKRYHGTGNSILPFSDDDPATSWKICPAKICTTIFEGCLWKCPPLAYLPLLAKKYKLPKIWKPYLAYEPLSPNCSDESLETFLKLREESFCKMCPAKTIPLKINNPMFNSSSYVAKHDRRIFL